MGAPLLDPPLPNKKGSRDGIQTNPGTSQVSMEGGGRGDAGAVLGGRLGEPGGGRCRGLEGDGYTYLW